MYPHVTQFETRSAQLFNLLRLNEERSRFQHAAAASGRRHVALPIARVGALPRVVLRLVAREGP